LNTQARRHTAAPSPPHRSVASGMLPVTRSHART
jgi:hypothetical protein